MKTVLITSAGSEIGLETAKKFLSDGWFVIGTCESGVIPLEAENFMCLNMKLSQPETISNIVNELAEKNIQIDVLINNGEVVFDKIETSMTEKEIKQILISNYLGLVELIEKMELRLKEAANIVNINIGILLIPLVEIGSNGYCLIERDVNVYLNVLASKLRNKKIFITNFNTGWVKMGLGSEGISTLKSINRDLEENVHEIFSLATIK